eukprot:1255303-Rhodomonas_salina.2
MLGLVFDFSSCGKSRLTFRGVWYCCWVWCYAASGTNVGYVCTRSSSNLRLGMTWRSAASAGTPRCPSSLP